ncbi:hypothetical protein AB6E05_19680 [Vibrio alginolyticus]|uniref:hypothetical protein n=1 Tax=Vibrio alginolyticus TaxID=663 RepID=UPI00186A8B95|nr:hypothetical protein [Vibrio parahaemolyticus]HAS6076781.1 hypothetical protein [Vibrio vulnificus]
MSSQTEQVFRTAKQWLALPEHKKRYPVRHATGKKGKRGIFFHISETKPVRGESSHHPQYYAVPIQDTYKGQKYYYFDECEEKKTYAQWRREGRIVRPGSVPCSGSRAGYNPETKEHFEIQYFLLSDTRKIRPDGR